MSGKLILMFILALAYTKAQDNELCPCDPNYKEKLKAFNNLLETFEKLSGEVESEAEKDRVYSVYPGLLKEFTCDCDEKQRQKRKTMQELPEELISEQNNPDPVLRKKKSIHVADRRCPRGLVRVMFICVPKAGLDSIDYD